MREIKFRAWHKKFSPELEEDGMGRINGMYQVKGIWISNSFQKYVDLNNFTMGSVDIWGWRSSCKINEVHLMQYTGLKDKNGKEIYEEDICKCYSYLDETDRTLNDFTIKKVYFGIDEGYPAFDLCPADDYAEYNGLQHYSSIKPDNVNIEIIGNIYENPKLLKGTP